MRRAFAIFSVSKRCKETDNPNATYRVKRVTDDNGLELYETYETVNGFERQIGGYGKKTLEEAKKCIDSYKKSAKKDYNSKYTKQEQWVYVC